jgi:RHS repeat-associated protein
VTTTFTPTADAYVDNSSGQSSKNFGTATTLLVANTGDKKSYLLFNVTGLPAGSITGAILRVYATIADAAGFAAHSSTTTSWTETGIKYSNAPTYGASLGTSGAVTANNWASVAVNSAVTSAGLKTLVIDKNGASNGTYQSREGVNDPQLLVSVATSPPADVTAPTVPAGLSATATSGSQVNLAWTGATDAVGVQGYKIYRNGTYVSSIGPVGSTTVSDIGLASATAYTYRVSAIDAVGNESAQSVATGASTGTLDPTSNVTTYTYDVMDRVATRTDPLGHGETFGYDAAGHPNTATDRKGLVTTASYDALGRRTFVGFNTVTNGGSTTYESTITTTFDAADRTHDLVDTAAGTITYGYDGLDRIASETSTQGAVTYAYDDAGRRTRMTLAGQPDVIYAYDNANRMTGITQATSSVGFTYDDAGRQLTLTLPNGIVGTYGYNDASETTSISYAQGATAVGDLAYTYDLAGRRATVSGSLARTGLPVAMASATYNADNQLTSWAGSTLSYDLNGNLLADATRTYTWNARNELTQIKTGQTVTASFAYDATGRRSTRTIAGSAGTFAYDGPNVTQEQTGGSPSANALSGGTDQIFSRTDGSGTRSYLTDALGSTVALADPAGAISTSYTYDPFGATTSSGATSTNATQFTGRENDGTGLYFYRARYYSPTYGRFISEDPAGFAGSGPNPYWYVGDNPINATDPSGELLPLLGFLAASCFGGAILGAMGAVAGQFGPQHILGGRKDHERNLVHDLLVGAAVGCGSAVIFEGIGLLASAFLGRLAAGAADAVETTTATQSSTSGAAQVADAGASSWTLGSFKSAAKWANQMAKRGWTSDQITDAILNGKQFQAINKVHPGNGATRYVNPTTGRSIVVDDTTREILQVGGDDFDF